MDSREWDERYAGSELLWRAEPNQFVAAEIAGLAPGAALDLATGEGRNAVWLAQQGWEVTGVDFSGAGLAKARKLAEERNVTVTWVQADLLEYEPPPSSFGLVLVAYVHLDAAGLRTVLGRAAAALAPGGTALVIGHDVSNLTDGVGPQDPALLYTPDSIADGLAGLRVKRAERVRRPVGTAEGTRDAIDTLVRAIRPRC
jgi:SAM-dependent methyltransferase